MEEVELGGLGDDDGDCAGFSRIDEDYPFPTIPEREEVLPFRLNDVHEVPFCGILYVMQSYM